MGGTRPVIESESQARKVMSPSDAWGLKMVTKEVMNIVHTFGFGFSCISVGLCRIGEVFGGVADFQGERLVRVPPGTCFPPRQWGFLL